MKRLIILSLACLFAAAGWTQNRSDSYVEVLYFHGKQRCATCKAIEQCTKQVVETDFADLVKTGQVRYREVDTATAEGKKLAESYRVGWSSLYVNRWSGGREERSDLTRLGFRYARSNAETFKRELKQRIRQLLN